jgi:hypothetical protein
LQFRDDCSGSQVKTAALWATPVVLTLAMLDTVLPVIAGIVQVIVTCYVIYPPKHNKKRFVRIIAVLGIVGITASTWAAKRQHDENSVAEIGLDSRRWDDTAQFLVPDKDLFLHMKLKVSSGDARDVQTSFQGFTMWGQPSPEQNREAIARFKKFFIDHPNVPQNHERGTILFFDVNYRFDRAQIEDIKSARSVIYAMAHAEWKNKAGADFHYDSYEWMEVPQTDFIGAQGWHSLSQ